MRFEVTLVSGHDWPWVTYTVPATYPAQAARRAIKRAESDHPSRVFATLATRKVA